MSLTSCAFVTHFFSLWSIWITFICWAECLGKISSYMQIRYIFWSKTEAQCVNIRTSSRGYLQKNRKERHSLKQSGKQEKKENLLWYNMMLWCLYQLEWPNQNPLPSCSAGATRKVRQDLHVQFQAEGIQHGSSCPLSPSTAWEEASFLANGITMQQSPELRRNASDRATQLWMKLPLDNSSKITIQQIPANILLFSGLQLREKKVLLF